MAYEPTEADVDVLLEALTAWKNKDALDGIMDSVMGSIIIQGDSAAKQKEGESRRARDLKRSEARKLREERATLLAAQLIQYKQGLAADKLHAEAQRD